MKKIDLYSFIHNAVNAAPRASITFFCFFSLSAAFELFLSRLMLSLAHSGRYDFHLAARYAPAMAEAAALSFLLALLGAVLFCRISKSNCNNGC